MHLDLYKNIMTLQSTLNSRIFPDWVERDFNWGRAIRQEVSEAIDSTPWKWWKFTEMDRDNLQVELVDIFHFMMSIAISQNIDPFSLKSAVDKGYGEINLSISHKAGKPGDFTNSLEDLILPSFLREGSLDVYTLFTSWGRSWAMLHLPLEVLYRSYVVKNVLNMFRQDKGYKEGTYIKNWKYKGAVSEDNVVANYHASVLLRDSSIDLPHRLLEKLEESYKDAVLSHSRSLNKLLSPKKIPA